MLERLNDWWASKRVPSALLKEYRRPLFYELVKHLEKKQILLVLGLRRVGKTTLAYQLIQHLLEKGVDEKHVLYFPFDDERAEVDDVLKQFEENVLFSSLREAGRLYVFFDEIQKQKNWQNKIKTFYDIYPNLKFVLTGSASALLEKKANESLAGRVYDFTLPPLDFKEFLLLKYVGSELAQKISSIEKKEISELDERFLKEKMLLKTVAEPLFLDFVRKGGLIEIAGEEDKHEIIHYARSLVEKVLNTDLPQAFALREPQLLETLFRLIASNPGMLLKHEGLAKQLGASRAAIAAYTYYLKYGMLVRLLYNYSKSVLSQEKKLKKAYPANTSFAYAYNEFQELPKLIECFTANSLEAKFFWRDPQKREVDCVIAQEETVLPVEVKYKQSLEESDYDGLMRFMQEFNTRKAVLVTKDRLQLVKKDGKNILLVPAWLLALCT